jgi:hypothetical protein
MKALRLAQADSFREVHSGRAPTLDLTREEGLPPSSLTHATSPSPSPSPIGRAPKAQSFAGVLGLVCSQSRVTADRQSVYAVLVGNCLLLFLSSKVKRPSCIVVLTHATVSLHQQCIRQGRFAFIIRNPIGCYTLVAKHGVSLSEWLSRIGLVISASPTFRSPEALFQRVTQIERRCATCVCV